MPDSQRQVLHILSHTLSFRENKRYEIKGAV